MKKRSKKKANIHNRDVGKPSMNSGRGGSKLIGHNKADRSTMDIDGSHGSRQMRKHGMAC